MKLLSKIILSLSAALTLSPLHLTADSGETSAKSTAPAADTILIVNFTETVPGVYGYASWQNNFAVAPKAGFRVQGNKGAQGNGGICQTLTPALDLGSCSFIEIALAVQPGNEVPDYSVALGDADGTQCSARVHVAQLMPGQPVWLRLKLTDFAVSSRDPGADGKVDWTKITQWHLQGDWVTKKPAQVLFIALRARR